MNANWVTIVLWAIVVGSVLYGMARGFGQESRLVIWQVLSIGVGLISIVIGWYLSHRISGYVLQQQTSQMPHWLAQVCVAWQREPRIGIWVTFFVCYLILSSLLHRIIRLAMSIVPMWLPRPLHRSRLLGGVLGGAMGFVRMAIAGAVLFVGLQYFSFPALAKESASSTPYNVLKGRIYDPWLKPVVSKALPVLDQGALKPLSQNINLFAVPSGQTGQSQGVLLVPKQISDLAHQLTDNVSGQQAKAKALYEWEIHHIHYDWQKYDDYVYHGKWDQQSPLQTLQTGKGVCADYALLYANLAHAAGLTVKIDEGLGGTANSYGSHAWNEIYLTQEQRWIDVDTTWGSSQDAWFDVPPNTFNQTHILQQTIVIDASSP